MPTNEGNWGHPIVALTAFFLVLVILFLVLRILTRVCIVRSFWWDDVTIILAVVRSLRPCRMCHHMLTIRQLGTTIGAGLDFVEVSYGFGKHQQFLTAYHLQEFRKYTYGEWIQTFATLMWTKVSICLFLMRIPHSKVLLRPLQWAVAFLLFSNTILTVMWIMQCQPLHAAWDNQGICLNRGAKEGIILAQAVISVISDFSFAAFPILILWRVQIDFKTKIGLWLLMSLGFITGACCLVRTVLNNQSVPLDETYDGIVNWMWRLIEVQVGIIAACIPTLRPLYGWLMRRTRGQGTQLDTNIKLVGKEREAWVDDHTKDVPKERRSGSIPRERTSRDRRDAMEAELVREGIVSTTRRQSSHHFTHAVNSDDNPRGAGSELQEEMHKYGIDESLV